MTTVLPQVGSRGTSTLLISHLLPIKDLFTFRSCLSPPSLCCAEPQLTETAEAGSPLNMAHGERGGKGLGAAEDYCVFNWLRKVGLKRQDSAFLGPISQGTISGKQPPETCFSCGADRGRKKGLSRHSTPLTPPPHTHTLSRRFWNNRLGMRGD